MQLTRGQTLVEVIVALGIVLLLITGLITGTTGAIRASDAGRVKSLAVAYAQEGIELTRVLRDANWDTFQSTNGMRCLNKNGEWSLAASCGMNIDNTYSRSVTFTWDGTKERMTVESAVSWQDSEGLRETKLTTYFTDWQ